MVIVTYSLDQNTRGLEGLAGMGAGVTLFRTDATILGVSTDYAKVKRLDLSRYFDLVTLLDN
jgi:hypothetical protein